jgi:hypothetical protein
MPPLSEINLNETVVYWRWLRNDRHNDPIVAPAVEINVKWEQQQTPGFDPQSRPIFFDVLVETSIDVPSGSILWYGELADWTGSASDQDNQLMQVATKDRSTDVRGQDVSYILRLRRYKSTLPVIDTDG